VRRCLAMSLELTADRVVVWFSRNRDRFRHLALIVALTLFAGGLFLSLRANPDILDRLSLLPILTILFVTYPLGMVITAADFHVMARISGFSVGFWAAIRISLYSNAANMLPIPGSLAVRMGALKVHGATLRRSGGLIILFTLIWGGIAFCYSAAWLAMQAPLELSKGLGLIGLAVLAGCALFAYRLRVPPSLFLAAALCRFSLVVAESFALMMAMHSVGVMAEYHQTAILVIASFLSSVVPAGIGVRETIIAILSPIAGIDPGTGFLAATASRIAGMTFLATLSAILYAVSRRNSTGRTRPPHRSFRPKLPASR
jgi:hypothetical protein